MEVTETEATGLKRAYRLKASATEIDTRVDARIEEVRPSAQLKGFRKGKAPRSLLKKMFGKSMMGEVMQQLVDETLRDHLENSGHKPAQQPAIRVVSESVDDGEDLDIEVTYELMPEIPSVELGAIELERLTVQVEDPAVDEALETLARNAKTFEAKEGAAENGDQVLIDFVGKVDGEAFEGGSAEEFPLELGQNRFVPGFEDQLVGAEAGQERAVSITFPEDYGAEHLAGKPAVFDVTVREVRAPKAAEINDDLAKRYEAEDLEALRGVIRDRIAEEYRGASRALLKRRLLDALADTVAFDVPPSMVDAEAKQIAHQLWHEANPDTPADEQNRDDITPDETHVSLAERRVRLGLLLADVGAQNKLELSEQEVANAAAQQARNYPGHEKAFFDFVMKNPQARQQVSAPLFEDKVVDYIFELAKVSERPVTADELKAEMAKLDDEAD